jgi:hypothetical protein
MVIVFGDESFENARQQTVVLNRRKLPVKPGGAAHRAMLAPNSPTLIRIKTVATQPEVEPVR